MQLTQGHSPAVTERTSSAQVQTAPPTETGALTRSLFEAFDGTTKQNVVAGAEVAMKHPRSDSIAALDGTCQNTCVYGVLHYKRGKINANFWGVDDPKKSAVAQRTSLAQVPKAPPTRIPLNTPHKKHELSLYYGRLNFFF